MRDLEEPWEIALGLAWEALVAGTTPVGCVVVDAEGHVATRARGRRYVREAAQGQLSYSHLAHAELNALAQLPPTRRYEDHIVLTTLEPCLLCVGAAVMATVGRVEYAGADPYGGAAHIQIQNAHTARLMPPITGPADGTTGMIGALLHYAFYSERSPDGAVVNAYQDCMPDFVSQVDGGGLTREVLRLKAEHRSSLRCWRSLVSSFRLPPVPLCVLVGVPGSAVWSFDRRSWVDQANFGDDRSADRMPDDLDRVVLQADALEGQIRTVHRWPVIHRQARPSRCRARSMTGGGWRPSSVSISRTGCRIHGAPLIRGGRRLPGIPEDAPSGGEILFPLHRTAAVPHLAEPPSELGRTK